MRLAAERAEHRNDNRLEVVRQWAVSHDIDMERLDTGQQWVVYAALRAYKVVGAVAPLRRILGFILSHCGMDLGSKVIGAILDVTDRAVRHTQALGPKDLLDQVRHPPGGNRPPKLLPEHVGPIAKFLVLHPGARAPQVQGFIKDTWGIEMERHTLHEYVVRYGLGGLQVDQVKRAPPFLAPPGMEAPLC